MDFLWKKISEKEKEEIKEQAKKIMNGFSLKISKINLPNVEQKDDTRLGEREESEHQISEMSREIIFENAPAKNKDFIIAEKKTW